MRNSHVKEKQFPHVGKAIPSCGKSDSLVWEFLTVCRSEHQVSARNYFFGSASEHLQGEKPLMEGKREEYAPPLYPTSLIICPSVASGTIFLN